MKTVEITDQNIAEVVANSQNVVVVDFGAEWCPPCRMMGPVIEKLAEDLDGKAVVGKLDVDANPQATAKFGVRNLPTFLLFKDGNVVDRIIGAVPKSVLEQKVTSQI
jgi:thioredoxin 1